ncbi:hypothetical protein Tco_0824610 [Tanacetum coccineum]|uniref:Uncharacterized protein n=1 Tax=Tanacetum coccineum TaxID=301880 RepID=A0ABQ5ALA1_9ASTR
MKRLADLKAEREKSEKKLKKLSLADIQAQAQKLAKFEAKRKKLLDEYNHYIIYRADKLLITKIIYKIDRVTKDATMRIERNKQPLSLTVHENFKLKQLGFNEWIEIHALASKVKSKSNTAPKSQGQKRKRSSEIIHEVFVKDNIVVDGMQRNLVPLRGVEGTRGLVIKDLNQGSSSTMRGSPEAEEMFAKLKLTIKARNDVTEARKVVKGNLDTHRYQRLVECKASANCEGLAESKASARNLRRIQVTDIVKEVEDYLKTYSSARMDISWLFELKHVPSTKLVKAVNSWQNCSLKYGRDVSKNGRALNTSYVLHRIPDTSQLPPLRMQPRIILDFVDDEAMDGAWAVFISK